MKAHGLLDGAGAQVLALDWLAKVVAPLSPYGQRRFAEVRPFVPGQERRARERAESIAALAATLDSSRLGAVRTALCELPDAAGAIARAAMGGLLDDPEFLELHRFCATAQRVDALLAETDRAPIANAAVRAVGGALAPGGRGETAFYLSDAFDPRLSRARRVAQRAQAQLDAARGRDVRRAARELGRDEITGDEFIVMRADLRGALPQGTRVLREAATYLLCTQEYGDAALAALRRRDEAADAAAAAEELVRTALCAVVREHAAGLEAAAAALGELDVLLACAAFTQRYRCVPAEVTRERVLAFEQGRFLPLEEDLAAAGRRFTPLDIELRDAAVLTGPNMGGKSVCLQTCGFVALCVAFALPVPATRARSALFDRIAWLGMGREAEIGGLLSSFAREVLELKEILAHGAPRLLIFADEFARTTTPREGKALLVALLARLRERAACGLLATHLAGIAQAAGTRHFAVRGLRGIPRRPAAERLDEAIAALSDAMDYSVGEVGGAEPPPGDAIALTALLGVDREFVEAAYRALVQ